MSHRYDGKGGSVYDDGDRAAKVSELLEKANQADATANSYGSIGYSGHAAAATRQADTLRQAAGKVERGEGVWDYEQRGYNG